MNCKEKAIEMRFKENLSYAQIAEKLRSEFPEDLTDRQVVDKIRCYCKSHPDYSKVTTKHRTPTKPRTKKADPIDNVSNIDIEYKGSSGETTYKAVIELMENQIITPELIMAAHKLDPVVWEVVTYRSNFWQSQAKDGVKILLYQTKITVKPKESKNIITFEMIDNYFDKKDYSKNKLPVECYNYDEAGEILEITVPDIHIGLLSWNKETGEDYDVKIARRNFFAFIYDVAMRCATQKIAKITLVTLGDLIHIDNNNQETTNGTFQQSDGRMEKIAEAAEDMLVDGITILGDIAPVEVVYIAGNHDRTTGYMLLRSVKNAFRKDPNINFDIAPNPCKARLFGKALIGWCHGDMNKKMNDGWIQNDYRKEFGESRFCEIHSGHLHSQSVVESNTGVIIRYLPKLCSASYWEHQQGYRSAKAMVCFRWNPNTGLREIWFANLLDGMSEDTLSLNNILK